MNATELIQRMQPVLEGLLMRLGEECRLATQSARTVTLDQTSYGRCCACGGGDVGLERLLSDPAAPFCMACQEERDAERAAAR